MKTITAETRMDICFDCEIPFGSEEAMLVKAGVLSIPVCLPCGKKREYLKKQLDNMKVLG